MAEYELIAAAGIEVPISHPEKVIFPELGVTKLDLVNYYLAVADAAVRQLRDRPTVLKRFANGAAAKPFFQKRIPDSAPDWLNTTEVNFPSGRTARELLPNDAAHLVWGVNLGVIDWNPWPVRLPDLDHPDELRVDLDPTPEASWDDVRQVALVAGAVLRDHGLTGWPKTSGSRGIHINVRIHPEHDFVTVRRAAVALAREVERRAPEIASSKWWKEERRGVFVDFNQNLRDRTVASAYSVRPTPDARVSTPLAWDEVEAVEAEALRIDTVPARLAEHGDPHAEMDAAAGSLDALLALAQADEDAGLPDAPWPPHFKKQAGEPPRVAPSRARKRPAGG
ncbi:MAG TPA: DNA polymerase domain-containing protein [Solirubrobacteraceae bacterium]|nr:DNA polymerase domain-containing protein [Solirubrobacteraceae bacterium]